MKIKWTDDLSVGVEVIDNQHRKLIAVIDSFIKSIKKDEGKEAASTVLDFLREYVETHFVMEEELMQRIGYPDDNYLEHETRHTEFWEKFSELRKEFDSDYNSTETITSIKNNLIDWFINHICNIDKQIGVYYRITNKI